MSSDKRTVCKDCGLPEEDHHTFNPRMSGPAGCICDPNSWRRDPIPGVCTSFYPDEEYPEQCATCEHEKECHRGEKNADG